jgi:hypothetical protein
MTGFLGISAAFKRPSITYIYVNKKLRITGTSQRKIGIKIALKRTK